MSSFVLTICKLLVLTIVLSDVNMTSSQLSLYKFAEISFSERYELI